MKILRQWKGKDAVVFYQKEFKETPDSIKGIDYIELVELSEHNDINAYLVYCKEVKEEVKAA